MNGSTKEVRNMQGGKERHFKQLKGRRVSFQGGSKESSKKNRKKSKKKNYTNKNKILRKKSKELKAKE